MCLHLQFFVRGKLLAPGTEYSGPQSYADFLGDAKDIEVARYRKAELEAHGYTGVEIYERPLPRKVE